MNADIFPPATAADMVASARHVLAHILPEDTPPPTPKEAAKAKREASGLVEWLRGNLKNHRNRAELAAELEGRILAKISRIYLMWGLSTDAAYLGQFLMNVEALLNEAGPEACAAMGRADFRVEEEYHQLKKAAHSLSLEAGRLHSQRLEDAANVLRAMMGPFRIEPEAPANAAHKESGRKGGKSSREKSSAARKELKRRYLAGIPDKWKTPTEAARALKDDALSMGAITSAERALQTLGDWFREADRGNME